MHHYHSKNLLWSSSSLHKKSSEPISMQLWNCLLLCGNKNVIPSIFYGFFTSWNSFMHTLGIMYYSCLKIGQYSTENLLKFLHFYLVNEEINFVVALFVLYTHILDSPYGKSGCRTR